MSTRPLCVFAPLRATKSAISGVIVGIVAIGLLGFFGAAKLHAAEDDPVAAAMASLDEYMAAFNARDPEAWAVTLNYPHVRIAGASVRVWETQREYADYMDFDAFAQRYGWDHSQWDKREVVQSGPDKVHIATTFSRFNADGEKIATYDSLYIVTKRDGHWGTQARSSFAP